MLCALSLIEETFFSLTLIIWTLATGNEAGLDQRLIQLASGILSEEERLRARRFQFDADRNRFLLSHALCRLMLSSQGEYEPAFWQFDREIQGRPYVTNSISPLDFNLSHTRGMVGCALSTSGRVGFDLEHRLRAVNISRLAEKKFAAKETEDVLALSDKEQRDQFFRYWTLKEAYIKVTGRGLREALDSFCFDLTSAHPRCQLGDQNSNRYSFGLFSASQEHQAAWALEAREKQTLLPEIHNLSLKEFQEMLL
jgi:4'-phosphopantetheinyl transferase